MKNSIGELEKALMELNEDFREVIVLRDIQELTYEEISEITGTAMGTVKSRINRGRAQIQEIIGDYVKSRSEEHTSELQSRGHLVCRLLLEKKKKRYKTSSD